MCSSKSRGESTKGINQAQVKTETTNFKNLLNSELSRGLPEDQRKDFYYHSAQYVDSALDDMLRTVTDKNVMANIEEKIKSENVLINIEYPELAGTEKQINYAKNLLNRRLRREVDSVMDRLPSEQFPEKRKEAQKQFIEQAKKYNPSIETFSDAFNYGLKNRKGGVIEFLKGTNSASKIIDKYK